MQRDPVIRAREADMNLMEQARRRVAAAHEMQRVPLRWIATEAVAVELGGDGTLEGLPIERGSPRSEWGLQLVLA